MTATENIGLDIAHQLHQHLKALLAPHMELPLVRSIALQSITTLSAVVLADVLRGWKPDQRDRMIQTFADKVRHVAEELMQTHQHTQEG